MCEREEAKWSYCVYPAFSRSLLEKDAEEWDDDQNKVWGFREISRVGDH